MRRFPGCPFGPMQLRHVLRPGREPGERLIGWCLVRPAMDLASVLLLTAAGLVPYIGAFAGVVVQRRSRLMVLTDRRMILIPLDKAALKPKHSRKVSVIDLGLVQVSYPPHARRERHARGHSFTLSDPSLPRPSRYTIAWSEKHRAVRLFVRGLALLASDGV